MNSSENKQTDSWKGTSLSDLYKGRGPWCFGINPITICKYHAVLYELPVTLKEAPKPHVSSNPQHWDQLHVRMPYSEKNLFPLIEVSHWFFFYRIIYKCIFHIL